VFYRRGCGERNTSQAARGQIVHVLKACIRIHDADNAQLSLAKESQTKAKATDFPMKDKIMHTLQVNLEVSGAGINVVP
jgi:hypothetical protein